MGGRPPTVAPPLAEASTPTAPQLVPCLLFRRGEVYLPGEEGPVPARTADGARVDPFDIVDRLAAEYALIYLVDLDGIERGEPQLDFLQEFSREATLWVDGGVRRADQAIDILVAGARRAVLSSALLQGMRELRRAWRLSTELVFELELDPRGLVRANTWETADPAGLLAEVRALGLDHAVVSPREVDPNWPLIAAVAAGGPTWVDGTFDRAQMPELVRSGARGGIFHLDDQALAGIEGAPSSPPLASRPARDDDT